MTEVTATGLAKEVISEHYQSLLGIDPFVLLPKM